MAHAHGPASTETRHLRTLFALGAAGMLSDGQLLERFATLGGDPAELAFAALVERHGAMVLRVARSTSIDEPSAHDAFQATFLILARKARTLWVRDSLGPWLHAVARRVAAQSRSRERRRMIQERGAARPEAHRDDDGDRSDLARAIHQEIDRLPPPYRLAVLACHLEGLTQHEAAARLGWPIGTLQSRLARGRRRLRDRLQRRGLAPSLGILAGKLAPVPPALTASTAKAAATLHLGGKAAGVVAPAALALIEITTKGMLMTKLKLGAVALLIACGLAGSGVALGVGGVGDATEDSPASRKVEPTRLEGLRAPEPSPKPQPIDVDGDVKPDAPAEESRVDASLVPQPDGPNFPVLMNFHAYNRGEPGPSMKPGIDALIARGYPVMSIDIDKSPALRDRYKVTALPAFIVVDGSGNILARSGGMMSADRLAAFYNEAAAGRDASAFARANSSAEAPAAAPQQGNPEKPISEPALDILPVPRPWETVVRIKVHVSDKEWGFGSGTVISSTPEESIILTVAHLFRVKERPQPSPGDYRVPITVDLFGGEFVRHQPAQLACNQKDVPGEVIDYDFASNLGLIRIRPVRILPISKVVPISWQPKTGMGLLTAGCSNGEDATAWNTKILDPQARLGNASSRESFAMIKCAYQPKQGRSGGGLYTPDGQVAGICAFADPAEHVGLYITPEAIRELLERNALASAQAPGGMKVRMPSSRRSLPSSATESGSGPIDVAPDSWKWKPSTLPGPAARPAPSKAASDRERLDDLEHKLDQVLKALEALKGDVPSGQLKRDPGPDGPLKP